MTSAGENRARTLLWLVNLVLAGSAAWLVVDAWRPAPSGGIVPVAAGGAAPAGPTVQVAAPVDYRAILDRNVFRAVTKASREEAAAKTAKTTAPTTPEAPPAPPPWEPKLRLLGTVAASPRFARAVIEDLVDGKTQAYRIGEAVQGATVKGIERYRVVLERDGREYPLEFGLEGLATRGANGDADSAAAADPGVPSLASVAVGIKELSGSAFELNREAIMTELKRHIGSPHELFKDIQLAPVEADGETVGMRVTGLANVGLARLAGIEDGDVIQSINGMRLRSQQEAYQVFRSVRRQKEFKVVLQRDGHMKSYSFKLQ